MVRGLFTLTWAARLRRGRSPRQGLDGGVAGAVPVSVAVTSTGEALTAPPRRQVSPGKRKRRPRGPGRHGCSHPHRSLRQAVLLKANARAGPALAQGFLTKGIQEMPLPDAEPTRR